MSASLVGSEMCIRDRAWLVPRWVRPHALAVHVLLGCEARADLTGLLNQRAVWMARVRGTTHVGTEQL
eukprot:14296376-Alexandrium_andersonii.AAC.1